jgi:hypothetical protein
METPPLFFVTAGLLLGLVVEAVVTSKPWGKTSLAIYAVVALWYFGDFLQNNREFYSQFPTSRIDWAFAQICVFLVAFRSFVAWLHPRLSDAVAESSLDLTRPLGPEESRFFGVLVIAWGFLTAVALYRVDGDVVSVFLPMLYEEPRMPWARSAVGTGLDFLIAAAEYSHLAVGGLLGIVVVLGRRPLVRVVSLALFVSVLIPYLFQHARHRPLAVLVPGVLAFAIASRASWIIKGFVTLLLSVLTMSWFVFMTDARSGQSEWAEARIGAIADRPDSDDPLVIGLDMMQELCHIGSLRDAGYYNPGFLGEYYQELCAFIPRSMWPNKPMIGIDYAIARGFYDPTATNLVSATISRGLIGQGVANCGSYLGPAVEALLTACWIGFLGRLWRRRGHPEAICLFLLGLGLTVNMGRGISFLAVFPFVFAYAGLAVYNYFRAKPRPVGQRATVFR